ncbi:MAG: hypothetical protein RhofKO_28240 [Rhodothermales bacterium]
MSLLKRLARAGNAVAGAAADKVRTTAEHLIDEASGLAEDALDKVRGIEPEPEAAPEDQTKAAPTPEPEQETPKVAMPQTPATSEKVKHAPDTPMPDKTVGRPLPRDTA